MKYCKKCGMLLEDTIDICIRCGTDVKDPDNVSKYPPGMEKKIEADKKASKTRTTTLIAIILVFLLLIVLVIVFFLNSSNITANNEPAQQAVEETIPEEEVSEPEPEVTEVPEEPKVRKNIKDDTGLYYNIATLTDAGGNVIFTGVYPEDFSIIAMDVDYTKYSDKFPGLVTFKVGDVEDTVHFTYLSPQQFWYRDSETGDTRKNERDLFFYMSYLTYDGSQGYVDALLKSSYPDAKEIKLVETTERSAASESLNTLSKSCQKLLNKDIGDYGHVAQDAVYAPMKSEFCSEEFRYEVTLKDKSKVFLNCYVPLVANHLIYSSQEANDKGNLTEWITMGVFVFEAGNEDLYDDYLPLYRVFADNTAINKTFYSIMESYGKEIALAISENREPEGLNESTLSKYASGNADLSEPFSNFCDFTSVPVGEAGFASDNMTVYAPGDVQAAYYNKDDGKLFLTTDAEEYPGDTYEELVLTVAPETTATTEEGTNEGTDGNTGDDADEASRR